MKRDDKRPVDGYVPDTEPVIMRDLHRCDLCGTLTGNVRQDLATGGVDDDICDTCLREHYPHVNW